MNLRAAYFPTLFLIAASSHAQTAPAMSPPRPAYLELRWDENWSYLRNRSYRTDYTDPLKYINLGRSGWYVSVGGESRTRYELFRNATFGSVPNTPNGFLIQRFLAHADFHLGSKVRVFVQLQSGLETGRLGGPRATDKDQFEIHQGFVDLSSSDDSKKAVTLRLGRQELEFGSGHYLSASEVFNIRRSFDGARVLWQTGRYTWNALAARPVELNPGVFDDSPDHTQTLWAAGIFGPNPLIAKSNVSLYYLGYSRRLGAFDKGTGRETRHTIGTRWWATRGTLDYNYEGLLQLGTFRNGDVRAFALAGETGVSRLNWRFSPRFALRADLASGDRNRTGQTLGTFNPLFPTTAYSGRIGLIGASNVVDVTPNARFRLHKRVYFLPETSFFWRQSKQDGIYSVLGTPLRTGRLSNARFVGTQASAPLQLTIDRHLTWTGVVTRFYSGAYLKQTPPGRSVTYFTTFLTYRF
jgi:hypothetical protein